MGLRFRKSISVAPGVKVNVNKKSASVTVGKKGAHYTMSTSGKQTASVGLPGTGLSYSKSFGGKKKSSKSSSSKTGNSSSSQSVGETVENVAQTAANNSGCIILAVAAVVILALIVLGIWGIVKLVSNHTSKETASDNVAVTQTADSDSSDSQSVANSSSGNSSSEQVWVTASGSKYHSKSDCGGISNAYQITLEEAETRGLTPCKKCH
ncbi:MAG: DUF4236 domain-containing protein [Lachnospiraceae bacterium]|nr:DUF4236 domain-containing protein [Lachnospiraceae bacterium]